MKKLIIFLLLGSFSGIAIAQRVCDNTVTAQQCQDVINIASLEQQITQLKLQEMANRADYDTVASQETIANETATLTNLQSVASKGASNSIQTVNSGV